MAGGIHPPENVQRLAPLVFPVDARQQPIGLQVAHRGHGNAVLGQRPGQPPAEVHAGQHVLAVGVHLLDGPAQPALGALRVRFAGMPDVHGAEVGIAGVGIADAQEDSQLALVPELLQGRHRRMEAQLVVDGDNLVFGNGQAGAIVPVQPVGPGNHGVQPVVPAGEGQYREHPVFVGRNHLVSSSKLPPVAGWRRRPERNRNGTPGRRVGTPVTRTGTRRWKRSSGTFPRCGG